MPTFTWKRAVVAALFGAAIPCAAVVAGADGGEGFPPDPPGHASLKQWSFDVVVQKGVPSLAAAKASTLQKPAESPRVLGRFAIELLVGSELLDRVRFDVPLMGAPPTEKSPRHPFPRPGFEDVNTRVTVRMADHPRAVYAVLVDRATKKTTRYQWPPESDGKLLPWTVPHFDGPDAWPPPPSTPAPRDAGGGG